MSPRFTPPTASELDARLASDPAFRALVAERIAAEVAVSVAFGEGDRVAMADADERSAIAYENVLLAISGATEEYERQCDAYHARYQRVRAAAAE